jgi:hypothetical protein
MGTLFIFSSQNTLQLRYPLELFNTYDDYYFIEIGYFAVSPLDELYPFLEKRTTGFTTVSVFEQNMLSTMSLALSMGWKSGSDSWRCSDIHSLM